jgi:hypothetical protein
MWLPYYPFIPYKAKEVVVLKLSKELLKLILVIAVVAVDEPELSLTKLLVEPEFVSIPVNDLKVFVLVVDV